jgi:hypothetical protein
MNFQRAPLSIVRSIRQISLVRTWLRLRRGHAVPNLGDYEPDTRNDDAPDSLICAVSDGGASLRFRCIKAGSRVVLANDAPIEGRYLDECMSYVASAAGAALNACIGQKLPVYSIAPASDSDGCPVTLEQLFLPFSSDHHTANYMLASFHAFSSEGRFRSPGLLAQKPKIARQWAVAIDPTLPVAEVKQQAEVVEV